MGSRLKRRAGPGGLCLPLRVPVLRSAITVDLELYCAGVNITASATTLPSAPVAQMEMLPDPVLYPALNEYRPRENQVPALTRWFT